MNSGIQDINRLLLRNHDEEGPLRCRVENIRIALRMAIHAREVEERSWKYTNDSALLAGWRQCEQALAAGRELEIVP